MRVRCGSHRMRSQHQAMENPEKIRLEGHTGLCVILDSMPRLHLLCKVGRPPGTASECITAQCFRWPVGSDQQSALPCRARHGMGYNEAKAVTSADGWDETC